MWPNTDFDIGKLWEWVFKAENKPTFDDTISPLVFDICSTITFIGKGEFDTITSLWSGLCWLLLSTYSTASGYMSSIKTWGWMKVLVVFCQTPSLSCVFLTFTGVEWDRGLGGGRRCWSGLHCHSVILLQPVLLVQRLCRNMNNCHHCITL